MDRHYLVKYIDIIILLIIVSIILFYYPRFRKIFIHPIIHSPNLTRLFAKKRLMIVIISIITILISYGICFIICTIYNSTKPPWEGVEILPIDILSFATIIIVILAVIFQHSPMLTTGGIRSVTDYTAISPYFYIFLLYIIISWIILYATDFDQFLKSKWPNLFTILANPIIGTSKLRIIGTPLIFSMSVLLSTYIYDEVYRSKK